MTEADDCLPVCGYECQHESTITTVVAELNDDALTNAKFEFAGPRLAKARVMSSLAVDENFGTIINGNIERTHDALR